MEKTSRCDFALPKGVGSIGVMNSTRSNSFFPRLKTWGTQCAMMWIRAPRNVKPAISMWKWIGSWDGNPGSKTTRITTAWLMDTWTVLDDYSETGKKIIKNQVTSVGIHWRAEPICLRAAAELARRDRGSLIHSRASLIRWRGMWLL